MPAESSSLSQPVLSDGQASAAPSAPATPPCRVCGDPKNVGLYDPDHPERAICIDCCPRAEHHDGETGHVWTYDRWEQDRVCDHCGQFAANTDFYQHLGD